MFFDPSLVLEERMLTDTVISTSRDYWDSATEMTTHIHSMIKNFDIGAYVNANNQYYVAAFVLVLMLVVIKLGWMITRKLIAYCRSSKSQNVITTGATLKASISSGWISHIKSTVQNWLYQLKCWCNQGVQLLFVRPIMFIRQSVLGRLGIPIFGAHGASSNDNIMMQIALYTQNPSQSSDKLKEMCNYTLNQIAVARSRGEYDRALKLKVIYDQLNVDQIRLLQKK